MQTNPIQKGDTVTVRPDIRKYGGLTGTVIDHGVGYRAGDVFVVFAEVSEPLWFAVEELVTEDGGQ